MLCVLHGDGHGGKADWNVRGSHQGTSFTGKKGPCPKPGHRRHQKEITILT